MFRSSFSAPFTAALMLLLSCSWSAGQREVLDCFRGAVSTMEGGDWESAMEVISSSTEALLDSLSSDFTARGLYGYEQVVDLLRVMYQEYIDFDGEVTMIFVEGDRAEVTISPDDQRKYQMVFEQGEWKLDLSEVFRADIQEALRGSYVYH
ncbi:MAG: hypothetical protein JXA64_12275 [Candidatus Fermentibacteraceae bacterium]|nr:hypothetical protein [Candidatus Fermentibacteraceae bacterium]